MKKKKYTVIWGGENMGEFSALSKEEAILAATHESGGGWDNPQIVDGEVIDDDGTTVSLDVFKVYESVDYTKTFFAAAAVAYDALRAEGWGDAPDDDEVTDIAELPEFGELLDDRWGHDVAVYFDGDKYTIVGDVHGPWAIGPLSLEQIEAYED